MLHTQYQVKPQKVPPAIPIKISSDLYNQIISGSKPSLLISKDLKRLTVNNQTIELKSMDTDGRVFKNKEKELLEVGLVTTKLAMPPTIHGSKFKEQMLKEEKSKKEKSAVFLDSVSDPSKTKVKKPIKSRPAVSSPIPPVKYIPSPNASKPVKRDDLLKNRLVHFLAPGPKPLQDCISRANASESAVLHELKLFEAYKDLDPFKYPLYTGVEREAAIRNAIIAFDAIGLAKDAPERTKLKSPLEKTEKKKVTKKADPKSPKKSPTETKKSLSVESKKTVPLKGVFAKLAEKPVEKKIEKPTDLVVDTKPLPKIILKKPISPSKKTTSPESASSKPETPQKRKLDTSPSSDTKKLKVESSSSSSSSILSPVDKEPTDVTVLMKTMFKNPLLEVLGPQQWSRMCVSELERYYTWLSNRSDKLEQKVSEFSSISSQLQASTKSMVTELDKMTTIRKTLIRAGIKMEPVQFLGEFSRIVQEAGARKKEKQDFCQWVTKQGGHIKRL